MTLPQKPYSENIPYLGPFAAMMVVGPVVVPARELHRYTRNPDQIVAYAPEDSDYILRENTFAIAIFVESPCLPDYPERVAEAFRDNEYYNPRDYVPWVVSLN